MTDVRIGVLGAARITPTALIAPARQVDGMTVTAVAARDRERAAAFAARHGIARVLDDYAAVVTDPDIDAVYIPLPNGLHAPWVLEAIASGKHVLCEKPFTSNAAQAREIADAVDARRRTGHAVTVMEAFHYRYHPLAARMREIVDTDLGAVGSVETTMCIPLPRFSDIRYQYDLAGGAMMDTGCYAMHAARLLGPGEPVVAGARARLLRRDSRIDRAMTVTLAYPNGATGVVRTSMWSTNLLRIAVRVTGERGTLSVLNFVAPQFFHRITVRVSNSRRHEKSIGEATYTHQLRAFVAAVRGEPTNLTPPSDSIATMTLVDAAYEAAGLPLRI
ncbi:MAG TPA: Gfo/Idh/MocA family oxidoreductase [Micromonosporaceae bacterium]|nr:Gfo/Idh/MocA family oxidoreductase [Micromonosporaceae bacterium]